MKKGFNVSFIFSVMAVFLLVFPMIVAASMIIPSNDKAREVAKATDNSPVIGENWDLERVDFIHFARPSKPPKGPKTEACYKLLGVKWKSQPVSYQINPSNPHGLSEEFVTSTLSTSAETWDAETSSELFNNAYTVDYSAAYGVQDFKNSIVFGDYSDTNAIAVTSIWFTRRGKQLVEFDMIFNTKFNWGDASLNPNLMDLQNIAVHELGHAAGLDDIYSTSCNSVTMYGYSGNGDLEKRTVEQPDITGLQQMYGI